MPSITRRPRRSALAIAVLAVVSTVVGVVGGPVAGAASEKPMSEAKARAWYVKAVCPANAIQTERQAALDALKAAGTTPQVGDPMPQTLRATAAKYAKAAQRSYELLADPPAPWPTALQANAAFAAAYAALIAQRAAAQDAATVPANPPTWDTVVAAQRVNLPLLRAGLGIATGTDPCASGRSASGDVTIQTVPSGADTFNSLSVGAVIF